MYKLAIIGGGRMACIFANNAREMGIETHAFSLESGFVDVSVFDYAYFVNILERERILEKCRDIGIDGVVATTELTVAVAAYIADRLGLNGIPIETAEVITNKYRNRNASSKVKDLFHPRYCEVYTANDIKNSNFTYPLILKPTSKGGKRGITVIRNADDIEQAYSYAMQESGGVLPLIIEEYIDGGMECSVESISYKGRHFIIQVTEKVTSGAPHCVELAHHQPAAISDETRCKLERVVSDLIASLGVEYGPCHTEIKIKDDKIYLIELNARPGGDHIAYPLTELSTGYSYIKGAICVALGTFNADDIKKTNCKHAGVMFVSKQTDYLKSLFDECEEYEWCYMKNNITEDLSTLVHNDGYNTNFIMYCADVIPNEIKEARKWEK